MSPRFFRLALCAREGDFSAQRPELNVSLCRIGSIGNELLFFGAKGSGYDRCLVIAQCRVCDGCGDSAGVVLGWKLIFGLRLV